MEQAPLCRFGNGRSNTVRNEKIRRAPDATQAFQDMLDLGVKTGQTAGLSGAAAMARRNMVTDAMLKSMGGNCINIGVVLERYADFCGQLRRDAEPRLKELAAGQTPAMKRFADSLARQKGIKLPPGYTTTISICRAFLNQHAPKKADAETVPVSLAPMVYAKKIAQGKGIVIPDCGLPVWEHRREHHHRARPRC